MNRKVLFTIVGFGLFILGFLSIVFSLIGARLSFLSFLDSFGGLAGFVIKLVMTVGGVLMAYLANTDWERERSECQ